MDSTYTTVSTVCAPSLLGSLVDLDVLDDQVAGVETLGVGVGLSVLEETEEELGGLDGPAGLGDTESLACVFIVNIMTLEKFQIRKSSIHSQFHLSIPPLLLRCVETQIPPLQDCRVHSPCAVRPVLPAYRLMGTASLCSRTLPR